MDVQVAVFVRVGDLVVVDLTEPVVGRDRAGVGEDQTADGVGDGGVLLDAPVLLLDIAVHQLLIVEQGGLHVAQLFALTAVKDVCLRNVVIAGADKDGLDAVLNVLDGDLAVFDLRLEIRRDLQREEVDHAVVILLLLRDERLADGRGDLAEVEIHDLIVSLYYLVHDEFSSFLR